MSKRYVAYYRVSTDRQGVRGLGMEAQEAAVVGFLRGAELVAEFREVESGKVRERPELMKALAVCREKRCVLLIAKLDRLARNAAFVLGLRDSGVEFVACDMPDANRLTIGILAVVAEHEREMISQRTKDALAVARSRGVKLGNPDPMSALREAMRLRSERTREFRESLKPIVAEMREMGITTLGSIAAALTARGIKSFTGKNFVPETVRGLL